MPETFVVHYSEIALKGKNRPEFARALRRNIYQSLSPLGPVEIQTKENRFIVRTSVDPSEVKSRLSKVFGVSWFSRASVVAADYDEILKSVMESSDAVSRAESFKITSRRTEKSFPLSSMELDRRLGAEMVKKTGRRVDLSNPKAEVHVDVVKGGAMVYSERARGPGGLPIGVGGRVLLLFSGGIDSPVAAWLLMKRGCRPVYLHFYLAPSPDYAIESKITKIIKLLAPFGGRSTLVLVPFAEYQMATLGASRDCEPSLFRRFMRVTAEELAPRFDSQAIATGDSLSQAASQTLWNIRVFDEGSSLPILRPLLTYDKDEIISLARRIGTYDFSVEEYKDCCAIITRHPKTRVRGELINDHARDLGFPSLAKRCLALSTVVSYNPSKGELKSGAFADLPRERDVVPVLDGGA